jgi:hypothetical protein
MNFQDSKGENMNLTLNIKKLAILMFTTAFLTNCAPGSFDSQTVSTSNNDNNHSQENPDASDPLNPGKTSEERKKELATIIDKTNMTGFVADSYGVNTSARAVDFDKTLGLIYIRTAMPLFANIVAFEMEVKKYPGIKVIGETLNNTSYMTVVVPVKYFLRDVTEASVNLPNGEIPHFPSGEGPSKAFLLTPNRAEKVYLYMNAEAIGVFTETKYDPTDLGDIVLNKLFFAIKNKEKTKIMGYVSLISAKNNTKGGYFASYRLDPNLSRILEEYYLY